MLLHAVHDTPGYIDIIIWSFYCALLNKVQCKLLALYKFHILIICDWFVQVNILPGTIQMTQHEETLKKTQYNTIQVSEGFCS